MRKKTAAVLLALLLPVGLAATAATNSGIFKSGLVKDLSLEVYFKSYLYKYNNGDLRDTDNTSTATVEVTDDNFFIGALELGGILKADLALGIKFYLDFYRQAYWGNDSAEYNTANAFYFRHIYFDAPLFGDDTAGMRVKLGRFYLSLLNVPGHHDWVFGDNIDALVLQYKSRKWGFDLFGDLFSMNAPVDSIYELRAERHSYTVPFFDGDVNTFRFGFMPWFKPVDEGGNKVLLRPFAFFSRVGAMGRSDGTLGGFEESDAGALGNAADNDFLFLSGISAFAKFGGFSAAAEFSYSLGKDRKLSPVPNVDIKGFMAHLSLAYKVSSVIDITAAGLYASGPETDSDGNYKNYGYTGFKAEKLGGFLFREYYGVYPYAILDGAGLTMTPNEAYRRAPVAAGVFRFDVTNLDLRTMRRGQGGLNLSLEAWIYLDTGSDKTDYSGTVSPEALNNKRFGKMMGIELDYKVSYVFGQGLLEVGVQGGIFLPDEYYTLPVSDATAPYGDDLFWGLCFFTELRF